MQLRKLQAWFSPAPILCMLTPTYEIIEFFPTMGMQFCGTHQYVHLQLINHLCQLNKFPKIQFSLFRSISPILNNLSWWNTQIEIKSIAYIDFKPNIHFSLWYQLPSSIKGNAHKYIKKYIFYHGYLLATFLINIFRDANSTHFRPSLMLRLLCKEI